jgi:hypothetical protein
MLAFVLVLYAQYPITMGYQDILSCVADLDKYSRPPYNLRGDCMSWTQAQKLKLVL